MGFKRAKNRLRQMITMQVMNRPWRTFWLTLLAGFLVGTLFGHLTTI